MYRIRTKPEYAGIFHNDKLLLKLTFEPLMKDMTLSVLSALSKARSVEATISKINWPESGYWYENEICTRQICDMVDLVEGDFRNKLKVMIKRNPVILNLIYRFEISI